MQIEINIYKLISKRIIFRVVYYLIFAASLLSITGLYSQETQQKVSKQSALEAFSKGEFESALNQFKELSNQFSLDPVYKYYSGACLVNLERDPSQAEVLLKSAIQRSAVIKTIPSDSWFYLGRAQQMTGKFEDAINSYDVYTKMVGKKIAKTFGVPDFMKQCSEKTGRINEVITLKEEQSRPPVSVVSVENPSIEDKTIINEEVKDEQLIQPLLAEYDDSLNTILISQYQADSITFLTDSLRKNMIVLSGERKVEMQKRINSLDSTAVLFQETADSQYVTKQSDTTGTEIVASENLNKEEIVTEKEAVADLDPITIEQKIDNTVPEPVQTEEIINQGNEVFLVFDLNYSKGNAGKIVPVNEPFPEGLIYLIQVAVFRNPVTYDFFKGMGPVNGLKAEGAVTSNYYVGVFRRFDDAGLALVDVRKAGFSDAFVVAFADGKQVSSERARVLEKEWGSQSLFKETKVVIAEQKEIAKDTIPTSLLFRVEVIQSKLPIKPDILESLKKLAGERGFDIFTNERGLQVFLIGKFINFESAAVYTDLLIRNGYKEARVVAYIGKKEIPVEMALKLFQM